jgi:hypothetical protein
MNYGAKADGVTDDAASVQKAVDACYAAGGGIVYMPAGTYLVYYAQPANSDCSGNILLRSGVTLCGAGATSTIIKGTRPLGNIIAASQKTNIGVRDLSVYSGISSPNFNGVKFYACTNASVENVVAHDLYIGIALYSCIDSNVKDSTAYNCSGVGITASTSYLPLQVGSNNVVSGCEAYGCFDGMSAAGYSPAAPYRRCIGTSFVSCNSHNNSRWGFRATYADNFAMTDCTATNNQYNVYVSGVINDGDGVTPDLHGIIPAIGTAQTIHNTTYGGAGGAAATIQTASTPDAYTYLYDHYGACSGIVVN